MLLLGTGAWVVYQIFVLRIGLFWVWHDLYHFGSLKLSHGFALTTLGDCLTNPTEKPASKGADIHQRGYSKPILLSSGLLERTIKNVHLRDDCRKNGLLCRKNASSKFCLKRSNFT